MPTANAWTLEISSNAVKLLGLTRRKNKEFEVVFASRDPYDSKGALPQAVKRAVEAAGVGTALVSTSVWASTMIIRKIALPKLKSGEISGALQLEADKYVPFGLEECVMDHYLFPPDPQGIKTDVMLVAAKKDLILERCQLLEGAGLKLSFMDIQPAALINWLLTIKPEAAKGVRVLVHIGDVPGKIQGEDNFVAVLKDGTPWVIRDLGDRFSAPDAAEEACAQTATLVANAVVFFENMTHTKPAEVLLSADAAVADRLAPAIERSAQVKPVRWSAGEGLHFTSDAAKAVFANAGPSFSCALGACARSLTS